MTKKNVDVEFDRDVGYPYHLQPDIIKMALFIHNATSEQEKIERVEFGTNKFDYKFMAHVMALLMLPYLWKLTCNQKNINNGRRTGRRSLTNPEYPIGYARTTMQFLHTPKILLENSGWAHP